MKITNWIARFFIPITIAVSLLGLWGMSGTASAFAQTVSVALPCTPLEQLHAEGKAAGVTVVTVLEKDNQGFLELFNKKLGLTLPPDGEFLGLLYGMKEGMPNAFIALVEEKNGVLCARYKTSGPRKLVENAIEAGLMGF